MFRTGFLPFIRSLVLYDIYLLLCIQYQTTDDGQKTCPKHVEFYSKNKVEKLVHLVGFIIRIPYICLFRHIKNQNQQIRFLEGGGVEAGEESPICLYLIPYTSSLQWLRWIETCSGLIIQNQRLPSPPLPQEKSSVF